MSTKKVSFSSDTYDPIIRRACCCEQNRMTTRQCVRCKVYISIYCCAHYLDQNYCFVCFSLK